MNTKAVPSAPNAAARFAKRATRARFSLLLLVILPFAVSRARAADAAVLTLDEADSRLAVAGRLVEGGVYARAAELAASVLDDPAAAALAGAPAETLDWRRRREAARFLLDRSRVGLAAARAEFLDAAASLVQLSNNRYRLPEPAYAVQAAYWAGRAYEEAGEYRAAADQYARVGGVSLPDGMEGNAAQRLSRCLRRLAEDIPYPGGIRDRQRRDALLTRAITELDRARLSFPVGMRRKEVELDLIALRLARREEQFVREAATEAEAFIDSDPARDAPRARAALYRGRAASLLGDADAAITWYRRVVEQEAPDDADRRAADLGLALALMEKGESSGADERRRLREQAAAALDRALDGVMSPGPWDGVRVVKAELLLDLGRPSAALEVLGPILADGRVNHRAWRLAGLAESARGRTGEALSLLYPATRPSNPARDVRFAASREAASAAESRRDFGLALSLNHHASRMLRRDRLFSTLLASEFQAMEILLKLGRMGGPTSLAADLDLLASDRDVPAVDAEAGRDAAVRALAASLGRVLAGGGDPDAGYDLGVAAEAAHEWTGDASAKLELAVSMIAHLTRRQPAGVTDSVLASRLGEARHAHALAAAGRVLAAPEPSEAAIDRILGDFAAAAASFQEAADAGGGGRRDSLDQGMVNLESGAFLFDLADRWERGRWSGNALLWRQEGRQRVEAALRPFNRAIAASGPSSLTARRARWSRGRALELLGEWRGAAADYLSLMNNSELPRTLRDNAARRWARCLREIGESRQALTRLAVFADADAEAALLAGKLAEESGDIPGAYRRFLFAADPAAPALPPATPGRAREAAYRAGRLALENPSRANPLLPPETVRANARRLLENSALAEPSGEWAAPMLNLLGDDLIGEDRDGWRRALRLARTVLASPDVDPALGRSMRLLAARALSAGGEYAQALDELDEARDLLADGPESRRDAAAVTLETARIYRLQDRDADALRAYAEVFAAYPEAVEEAETARDEAARMLLSDPAAGDREREQARNILSGLRDQVRAERIMREYGIR